MFAAKGQFIPVGGTWVEMVSTLGARSPSILLCYVLLSALELRLYTSAYIEKAA